MSAPVIAITGASGYIGRHLVAELARLGKYEVRLLSRGSGSPDRQPAPGANIRHFTGDLTQPESIADFIPAGATVVHLAYMWDAGESGNLQATQALIAQCAKAGAARLIHCSTAAVAGRVTETIVSEGLECRPVTEYGTTKLKIEQAVIAGARGRFDSVILRPTAVFGIDGEPLKKLAGDLARGSRLKNYAKSSLFGRRQMNLVHVANVVAAIVFMIGHPNPLDGGVFMVSDDDDRENNFAAVEGRLLQAFGRSSWRVPRLPVPLFVLEILLRLLGRNNVNPRTRYSPDKLLALGFVRPMGFVRGLTDYADWYRASYLDRGSGGPA